MSSLERAIAIAAEAHSGQFDFGGEPYILHPLRVMAMVSAPDERIVAVLHDVVEDCPEWPLDRLRAEGFSDVVLDGIAAATKRDGEPCADFVKRAGSNPLGRAVKIADLLDNSDLSRLPFPSEADRKRTEKYRLALSSLGIDL